MTALYKITVASRDPASGVTKIKVEEVSEEPGEIVPELYFGMQLLIDFLKVVMSPHVVWKWGQPRESLPKPPEPGAEPAMFYEVDASNPDDRVIKVMCTAFVEGVAWDKDERLFTIVPTHHAWTEQCVVGSSYDTASYCLRIPPPDKASSAPPLTPIDRTSAVEPVEDHRAGFRLAKPKRYYKRGGPERVRANELHEAAALDAAQGGDGVPPGGVSSGGGGGNDAADDDDDDDDASGEDKKAGAPPAFTAGGTFGGGGPSPASDVLDDSKPKPPVSFTSAQSGGMTVVKGGISKQSVFGGEAGVRDKDWRDSIPDKELLLPLHSAKKYTSLPPPEDLRELLHMPVLCRGGLGFGAAKPTDPPEVGTLLTIEEDGDTITIYTESECVESMATKSKHHIIGRAVLAKPRPRL